MYWIWNNILFTGTNWLLYTVIYCYIIYIYTFIGIIHLHRILLSCCSATLLRTAFFVFCDWRYSREVGKLSNWLVLKLRYGQYGDWANSTETAFNLWKHFGTPNLSTYHQVISYAACHVERYVLKQPEMSPCQCLSSQRQKRMEIRWNKSVSLVFGE